MIKYERPTQEHRIQRGNSVFPRIGDRQNLWGLLLAGGEGRRLRHFIKDLYGMDRPKQYCSIVGKRSMLRHTQDRAKLLIPSHRVLTVANYHHEDYVRDQLRGQPESSILFQPCSRDTGNGILLPLLHICRHDPTAIVAIFPSDQFILDEMRFMQYVSRAFSFVGNNPASVVLLGVSPTHIEPGYGWIEKGKAIASIRGTTVYQINQFREKPDIATAEYLFKQKALWNTFVMVGYVTTFLRQYQTVLPDLYNRLSQIISPSAGFYRQDLNAIYSSLPAINFSKTILETCATQYKVMEMTDTYWNDWGDASRILNDIRRHHLTLYNREPFKKSTGPR
jgi:mannose-1-phosphate guanylyltransferase